MIQQNILDNLEVTVLFCMVPRRKAFEYEEKKV